MQCHIDADQWTQCGSKMANLCLPCTEP